MGNKQNGSTELPQSVLQNLLAIQIQMIGGFVQEQEIGPLQCQPRQRDTAALTT